MGGVEASGPAGWWRRGAAGGDGLLSARVRWRGRAASRTGSPLQPPQPPQAPGPEGPRTRGLPGRGAGRTGDGPAAGRSRVLRVRARNRRRARRRSWRRRALRVLPPQGWLFLLFAGLVAIWAGTARWEPERMPLAAATLIVLLGGFFLRVRALTALLMVLGTAIAWALPAFTAPEYQAPSLVGPLLVVAATSAMVVLYARSRQRLGVQGTTGESMLVDLRDRLRAQGEVPGAAAGLARRDGAALAPTASPSPVTSSCRGARGTGALAGDRARRRLRQGPGRGDPGAAALGRVRRPARRASRRRVPARRQRVPAAPGVGGGLRDRGAPRGRPGGRTFRVASAGHPPAAHFHAGLGPVGGAGAAGTARPSGCSSARTTRPSTGGWSAATRCCSTPTGWWRRPVGTSTWASTGCMGQAERLVSRGFAGGAARIVDGTRAGETDDRALVLLWRS